MDGGGEPLTDAQKEAIVADVQAKKKEAKAAADKAVRAKKASALGVTPAKKPSGTAAAAAAASRSATSSKPTAAKGAMGAKAAKSGSGAAKTASAAGKAPTASKGAAAKSSNSPVKAKNGAASKKVSANVAAGVGSTSPSTPLPTSAPAAPEPTPEEREAERARKREEREKARAEMEQAIWEEERRIREAERRKREEAAMQRKLEEKLLEAAFDGEEEPVAQAVAQWREECASDLVGAKLNFEDANGHTMLSEAACGGHESICQLLLDAGAEVNTRNAQGRTPLWRAAFQARAGVVRLLLDRGGDPRIASQDAETPEMVASKEEVKAIIHAWDPMRTDELLALAAERDVQQWKPPPPDASDASTPSGQPGYSAQIIIQRFADVLEEITLASERYLLVVDLGGKVLTFLQYRDTNLLNYCRPKDVEPAALRSALVGALRYGKPLVMDMTLMPEFTLATLDELFSLVRPGLLETILDRKITKQEHWETLLTNEEKALDSDMRPSQWSEATTAYFCFVVVSKNPIVAEDVQERFFVVKVA